MKIKKGDKVKVIAGKFKGVIADVVMTKPREDRVVVEGVNVKKKSIKKTDASSTENFVYIQYPVHISNVRLATEAENKPAKSEKTEKKTKAVESKSKGKSEKKKSSKSK